LQVGKCSAERAQLVQRCASIAVQLLYAIGVLSVYQCTLLPICTVATAVKAICKHSRTGIMQGKDS
jgi:hypothetical protein